MLRRYLDQKFFNFVPVGRIQFSQNFTKFQTAAEPVEGQQTGVNIDNDSFRANRPQFVGAVQTLYFGQPERRLSP